MTGAQPHWPGRPRLAAEIALGGAAGALARVGLVAVLAAAPRGWPWDVLAANLAGTLLLGWLAGRARRSPRLARWLPLLGTGVAGSLTTFSALAVDAAQLAGTRPVAAVGYLGASVVAGLLLARWGLRHGEGRR